MYCRQIYNYYSTGFSNFVEIGTLDVTENLKPQNTTWVSLRLKIDRYILIFFEQIKIEMMVYSSYSNHRYTILLVSKLNYSLQIVDCIIILNIDIVDSSYPLKELYHGIKDKNSNIG